MSLQTIHHAYLGLGTNLGDRLHNLQEAVRLLPLQVRPVAFSPIYETPPWGYLDQPPFLNQVIQADTELSPLQLLAHLKDVETRMGRQANFRYGPRLIDLDILLYDELIFEAPNLTIPHPRLHERGFILVPLADLAAQYRHPGLGVTIAQLLARVDTQGIHPYHGD